jgi:hypothetical protein
LGTQVPTYENMQFDNVYLKAVKSWLEAHGHPAEAKSLSHEAVAECQADGMPIAEACAEILRLITILNLVAK